MITIVAALLGAFYGAITAKKRGGSPLDMAQYGGAYALVFAVIGLFVSVIVARML